jgi:hypothetical protein
MIGSFLAAVRARAPAYNKTLCKPPASKTRPAGKQDHQKHIASNRARLTRDQRARDDRI